MWFTASRIRLLFLAVLFFGGIFLLLARLWSLQIQNQDYFVQRIPGSSTVTVRVPPVRGLILDRHGKILADNEISYEASFDLEQIVRTFRAERDGPMPTFAYEIRPRESVRTRLTEEADIIGIFKEIVVPRLEALDLLADFNARRMRTHYHTHRGLIPFVYRDNLTYEEYARFAENIGNIPGLIVRHRARRHYPHGAMAGHLLGYLKHPESGMLPEHEAGEFQHYVPDDEGAVGIEQGLDEHLRGQPGRQTMRRNERGRLLEEIAFEPPVRGNDVVLTLDAEFQMVAERVMRQVGRGAAVVVDVRNGDIVAMASVPSFDPNHFIPRISTDQWNAYTQDPTHPLLATALGSYEPGSTYKIVAALGGALANREHDRFVCRGGVTYGNHFKRCWIHDRGGSHGSLDLVEAMQRSCNAYFYLLGNAIGGTPMVEAARLLGMHRPSGLEIRGEDHGIVMGDTFWREVIRRNPGRGMTPAEVANMVIGQGETKANPLQIAMASAAIANGGQVLQPRLVRRINLGHSNHMVYPDGSDGRQHPDDPIITADLLASGISAHAIEAIQEGMYKAVNVTGGTASNARAEGTTVSGKTGTAQTSIRGRRGNHAWFTGYFPSEEPRYAFTVVVLGGKGGGAVAAPLARRIIEGIVEIERDRIEPGSGGRPIMNALPPARGHFDAIEEIRFSEEDDPVVVSTPEPATFPQAGPAAAPEVRPARLIAPPPASIEDTPDAEGTVVRPDSG